MKGRITYYIGVCVVACLLSACGQDESVETIVSPEVPEGKVEVRFTLPGMVAEPLDGFAEGSRADAVTLENVPIKNLPDGTTLWLFAEDITPNEDLEEGEERDGDMKPKSYVVRDIDGMFDEENRPLQQLLPCEVDANGNIEHESDCKSYL